MGRARMNKEEQIHKRKQQINLCKRRRNLLQSVQQFAAKYGYRMAVAMMPLEQPGEKRTARTFDTEGDWNGFIEEFNKVVSNGRLGAEFVLPKPTNPPESNATETPINANDPNITTEDPEKEAGTEINVVDEIDNVIVGENVILGCHVASVEPGMQLDQQAVDDFHTLGDGVPIISMGATLIGGEASANTDPAANPGPSATKVQKPNSSTSKAPKILAPWQTYLDISDDSWDSDTE